MSSLLDFPLLFTKTCKNSHIVSKYLLQKIEIEFQWTILMLFYPQVWLTSLFDPFMSINVAQLKVMGTYFARNTTHTGKANWTLLDKKYIKSLQISIAISHFCRAKSVGGLHHNLPQRQLKLIPNAKTYNLYELLFGGLNWS